MYYAPASSRDRLCLDYPRSWEVFGKEELTQVCGGPYCNLGCWMQFAHTRPHIHSLLETVRPKLRPSNQRP